MRWLPRMAVTINSARRRFRLTRTSALLLPLHFTRANSFHLYMIFRLFSKMLDNDLESVDETNGIATQL